MELQFTMHGLPTFVPMGVANDGQCGSVRLLVEALRMFHAWQQHPARLENCLLPVCRETMTVLELHRRQILLTHRVVQ